MPETEEPLICWRCGASLQALSLPYRRLEQCLECSADLHVCKMCTSWAPRLDSGCDDIRAEGERDKELANFCEYFKPRPAAFVGAKQNDEAAKADLYGLFGMEAGQNDASSEAADARKKLDDLFGD